MSVVKTIMTLAFAVGVGLWPLISPAQHTIRSIREIQTFYSKAEKTADFDLTGQVLLTCASNPVRIDLIDTNSFDQLKAFLVCTNPPPFEAGDIVRARGVIRWMNFEPENASNATFTPCITNLTNLGPAPLPRTSAVTADVINSNDNVDFCISVEGVVASIQCDSTNSRWNWILLRTQRGKVYAAVTEHDYPLSSLIPLLDAEVEIRGIRGYFSGWRNFLGKHVFPFGKNGIIVTQTAPPPFDAKDMSYRSPSVLHRQKTRGTVIGANKDKIFIRDPWGRCMPTSLTSGQTRPAIGDQVSVSGFVDAAPMGFQMSEAILSGPRKMPESEIIPVPVTVERLFADDNGNMIANAKLYGKTVMIRGTVANSTEAIRTDGKILLESKNRLITVDVRHLTGAIAPGVSKGCIIDVVGLCLGDYESDVTKTTFPTFIGFRLIPRTVADITVIRAPSWWTPARLTIVIVFLAFVLVAITIWNRTLKTLSERRGKELLSQQLGKIRSDMRVNERTRLAVELHDALSQNLTGVSLQLDAVRRFAKDGTDRMFRHLAIAMRTLESCRTELRNCLWDLRNRALEEPDMNTAIRRTINPFIGDASLLIRFNVPRDSISDDTAHALMRILRELATNAVKHGHATTIRIAGTLENGLLLFSVRDDGTGFDTENHPGVNEGHFGLEGIRERIERLSGTMEVSSSHARGTTVTIAIQT